MLKPRSKVKLMTNCINILFSILFVFGLVSHPQAQAQAQAQTQSQTQATQSRDQIPVSDQALSPAAEERRKIIHQQLERIAVQDAGRFKPFGTFARESLQTIYGSSSLDGHPAVEVVLTWMLAPGIWETKSLILIERQDLKQALNLPLDTMMKYFAPRDLLTNDRFPLVLRELQNKRSSGEKLTPYYQAIQRLELQVGLFQQILAGQIPRWCPPSSASGGEAWLGLAQMPPELMTSFIAATKELISVLPADANKGQIKADDLVGPPHFVQEFAQKLRDQNPGVYPDSRMLEIEVHYNHLRPFVVAWVLDLLALLLLSGFWMTGGGRHSLRRSAFLLAILGLLIHTYGFALRMYLAGRPPVSNMYESVVWVAWGALLFSLIFELRLRRTRGYALSAGLAVSVLLLLTADLAPVTLDSSLQPLEPVLRSNLWLSVHVLTINISYAAFFLAWAVSMMGLVRLVQWQRSLQSSSVPLSSQTSQASQTSQKILAPFIEASYRAVQIGVVLLAAGTILGGVWADYSWGRFWGWDPKETWAFITLMGYLALLHARLVGWVRDLGWLSGCVMAATLVVMAWYGVNFILGVGKHSYGFGAGGVEYVSVLVLLQMIFLGYVGYISLKFTELAATAVRNPID